MAMCQLISCMVHIFLGLTELNLCVGVHGYFFHLKSQRYIDLLMVDKCTF